MGHNIPNLHSTIMTGTKKKMACLREELDSLYSSIMARPCVKPLFRYITVVILLPKVGRWLNKAFVPILSDCAGSVINRLRLEEDVVLIWVLNFCFLEPFLPLVFVRFHQVLLLVCQRTALLGLELFHAFIDGPRSFEVSTASLAELLTLHF